MGVEGARHQALPGLKAQQHVVAHPVLAWFWPPSARTPTPTTPAHAGPGTGQGAALQVQGLDGEVVAQVVGWPGANPPGPAAVHETRGLPGRDGLAIERGREGRGVEDGQVLAGRGARAG